MKKFRLMALVLVIAMAFVYGCAGKKLPVDIIKHELRDTATYTVILDDMDDRGTFFKSYYHKYRIVQEVGNFATDWMEVPKDYYELNKNFLGMTLASKTEGQTSDAKGPPGYEHVGNQRYGSWQRSSSGTSFWVFYGQYRLFSDLLGGNRIYRGDYNNYRNSRSGRQPYYGSNNQYGTKGSVTKSQKPNFYSRRAAKSSLRKSSFSDRVNRRVGRSRTGSRSRGYGGGK